MKKKRPILDDLRSPLDKVQRWWIRIPATLIIGIPALIVVLIIGTVEHIYKWFAIFIIPCLKGEDSTEE